MRIPGTPVHTAKGRPTAFAVPSVTAFQPDGSLVDLAHPRAADIDFADMANALSKIARFNGINRDPAYSVAQHSVMGADALFAETGDAVLAGYFILHDGHEYLIGDWTRPALALLVHHAWDYCNQDDRTAGFGRFVGLAIRKASEAAKATLDAAIFEAAGVPLISRMPAYLRAVKDMDARMLRAEGVALFGPKTKPHLPAVDLPPPRLTGAIRPWGAMKAEELFIDRLERYLNIVVRGN